ncbi:MAG: sugar O-acetyltransferase [Cyanobacteria bacterium J06628_6]
MPQTEREKMLADEPYYAADPELFEMHSRAQRLLDVFNRSSHGQQAQRQEMIQALFGRVGQNAEVKPSFRCDYGCHIFAGDNLYINYDCTILDCNTVTLGNHVLLAPGVHIYTAYHPTDSQMRRAGLEMAAPVVIGDNVWLGGRAIICPGVTIGNNTIVGAGSVVIRDLPENVLAVGNPCRVVRSHG